MSLLFFDGCGEYYDSSNLLDAWDDVTGSPVVNATGGRRSGAAIEFSGNMSLSKSVPTPADDTLFFGFAFKIPTQVANELVYFMEDTQTQINLDTTAAGEIRIERNGTLLHTTSTNTYLADTWHYLECKVVVHDTAGEVILNIDDVEVANLTSIDTKAGGSSFPNINRIRFLFGAGGLQATIDDVYIIDTAGSAPANTFIGDCQVDVVRPNGEGASTQWDTTFPASPTTHYTKVDENPADDDTTYNETVTVNDVDLFDVTTLPAVAGGGSAVIGVDVKAKTRRVDGGFADIQLVVRPTSTDYVSGSKPQSVDYLYHSNIWETNPEGGAWTDSIINAGEFGVKLV